MRLKEILQEKKVSQNELADMIGTSASAMSKIVNETTAPTTDTLQRIADALHIDIAELFAPIIRCPKCGAVFAAPEEQ